MLGQHKNIAAEIQCSLVYKSISQDIFEKAIFYCIVPMFENINSSIASVIFSSASIEIGIKMGIKSFFLSQVNSRKKFVQLLTIHIFDCSQYSEFALFSP